MYPIAVVYENIRTAIYNMANTQLIYNTRFRHRVQNVLGSTYTRLLRPKIGVEFLTKFGEFTGAKFCKHTCS